MIFYSFYFLLSPLLFLFIHFLKFFDKKIKDHIKHEDASFNNVLDMLSSVNRNEKKVLIFHAASAGEFEQLKPLLQKINREKYFVIQSFTSPTIYNKESTNDLFDISCYHPYDLWWKSYKFFSKIKPEAYIITRQDIWPAHLFIANRLKIKIFYINANLHNKSIWIKPFIKQFSKTIFKNLFLCLVPSKNIYTKFLQIIDTNKLVITGDSRFDQVIERAQRSNRVNYLPENYSQSFNIIFGSYDRYDEKYILYALKKMYIDGDHMLEKLNHRIILVPHEINTKTISRIKNSLNSLGFTYSLYSKLDKDSNKSRVLIVNQVGILADIYKVCKLAYVGSGFSDGVHSVIEPGVHGCAVGFGPNIELLDEAKSIYKKNLGIMIKNKNEMLSFLNLFNQKEVLDKLGNDIKKYIMRKSNASRKTISIIEKEI